jgi:hypothetical protein
MSTLFRAEHRGLRELHAAARHLYGHWKKLADRLEGRPGTVLRAGAATTRELLTALEAETRARGVESFPAAHGAGGRAAGLRNSAGDLLLERNQAARGAVLDAQHVSTLLGYLNRVATARGDEELAAFHAGWEARMREVEEEARAAAIALGCEPADAVTPAEQGPLGRAGHRVAVTVGAAGEAIDGSAVGRAARRFRRDDGG